MLKFHPLKVKARNEVADDAVCIAFEVPPELREHYRFEAGQHVGLRLSSGAEELRRTYSIVSCPDASELRIGVRVQPGGRASGWLARTLKVGDTLEVLTPNGSFHTRIEPDRAKRYVAFAAGSGITPVLSIAATVLEREPHSHFMLFYGNRTIASTMFVEEVLALKNRFPTRFAAHFLMSREPQEIDVLNGRLDGAKVGELAETFFRIDAVDEFFICGPGSMVEDVGTVLRARGAKGKIHSELFTTERVAAAPVEPKPVQAPVAPAQGVAQITVIMDGRRRTFSMRRDSHESILDAAGRAGLDLPYSCRGGVCSTCRTKVVKGEVHMGHNQALEDWEVEEGYALCCQARPMTPEIELTYDE
jgi:ring-1,2-phenylacetyl-CoA epoxidase subunit PaaE